MKKTAIKNNLLWFTLLLAMRVAQAADVAATNTPSAIPWNQIGAKAGADYKGDGLAVTPTDSGANLHCVFQRLDGEATSEGLWLTSTASDTVSDRFRVTAMAVGRIADAALTRPAGHPLSIRWGEEWDEGQLPRAGSVSVRGQTVRFSRPGLTEEYSVSMDGVRQDFIVEQAPPIPPGGELVVKLAVSGAKAEAVSDGARLVLENCGRKIAYNRLRVTDATGKELPARIEVCQVGDEVTSLNASDLFGNKVEEESLLTSAPTSGTLSAVVNDSDAVYPVRIDPTFSDANWVNIGSGLGDGEIQVQALAVAGSTLYAGGYFTSYIAQWNGNSWSALGSGLDYSGSQYIGSVEALAVSGSTLYAGGAFTEAGGVPANFVAQWNGTNWSALGSGLNGLVWALAVSGSTLYAGGYFTNVGGSGANYVAQWNGSSWSALGSGMNGTGVYALAVSGGTLYAGGLFTTAGGVSASNIAQWNGSSWSALGSGAGGSFPEVAALAVSGGTLYAGGNFTTAGGNPANCIAQWNGSSWSALGSGVSGVVDFNTSVNSLAVSGGTLYAGGYFTNAGGSAANSIAQWNGSSWSALGSGTAIGFYAIEVSGNTLYAGGFNGVFEAIPPVPLAITTNAAFGFTNGVFGFDFSGPPGSNVVIQVSTNLQTWIPLQTNLLVSAPLYFSDSQSPTNRQRFYRAVLSP